MLRWLSSDPAFGRLTWDDLPSTLARGEALPVRLTLKGDDWLPQAGAEVELSLTQPGRDVRRLRARTDAQGQSGRWYRISLPGLDAAGDRSRGGRGCRSGGGRDRRAAQLGATSGGPGSADLRETLAKASRGALFDWNTKRLGDVPLDASRQGGAGGHAARAAVEHPPWWMTLVILPALVAVLLRRRWELV